MVEFTYLYSYSAILHLKERVRKGGWGDSILLWFLAGKELASG